MLVAAYSSANASNTIIYSLRQSGKINTLAYLLTHYLFSTPPDCFERGLRAGHSETQWCLLMCVNPNERRHLWLRYDVVGLGYSTVLLVGPLSPLPINPRRTNSNSHSPHPTLTRPRSPSLAFHNPHLPLSGTSRSLSLISLMSNNEEKIRLLHKQEAHLLAQMQEVHAKIKECSDSTLARPDNHLEK